MYIYLYGGIQKGMLENIRQIILFIAVLLKVGISSLINAKGVSHWLEGELWGIGAEKLNQEPLLQDVSDEVSKGMGS